MAVAVLAAVTSAGPAWAAPALAGAAPIVGPAQINAIGHPNLCWQAGGNGSAITLEPCDPNLQGQQWSLTGDGVAVTFSLPPGLAAARLQAADGTGWTCAVRTATCTGTLPPSASSRIAITGRLPADAQPGDSYTVWADASVTGTSQLPGASGTSTTLSVPVLPAAPALPIPGAATLGIRSPLPLLAAIAGALLLTGALLLILLTRRTRPAPSSIG